jgi:hypothetical protein
MANKYTYQILRDTTTDAVIKLTGIFDGSSGQEANNARIQANTLSNALATNGYLLANATNRFANTSLSYYDLQVTGVKYFVNMPTSTTGSVEIFWNGYGTSPSTQYANSATIMHLNDSGEFGMGEQLPSILNNANNSLFNAPTVTSSNTASGDIGVYTYGATANSSYTLIISVRKNNAMYQRGQLSDPAAFNYGDYSLQPR